MISKKAILGIIGSLLSGLAGCYYTDDNTINLSEIEKKGYLTEECVMKMADYSEGETIDMPDDCFVEIVRESIPLPEKGDTFLTISPKEDADRFLDNHGYGGAYAEGLSTSVAGDHYVQVRSGKGFTSIFETVAHELGHLEKEPKNSVFGNHLMAEFYPTLGSYNLLSLLDDHKELFLDDDYGRIPILPYILILPIKYSPVQYDDPATEDFDESEMDYLLPDAVHDRDFWSHNIDFVPAEASRELRLVKFEGDVLAVYKDTKSLDYESEYEYVSDYYFGLEGEELYKALLETRESAKWAITDHIENGTDFGDMAQYAPWVMMDN